MFLQLKEISLGIESITFSGTVPASAAGSGQSGNHKRLTMPPKPALCSAELLEMGTTIKASIPVVGLNARI